MNTQTKTTATYDPTALYTKWSEAAKHTRWSYKNERIVEFNRAMQRADAWDNGAANVYVVDDLAAYLIEQMRDLDSTAKDTRATYADMLNDIHVSTVTGAQTETGHGDHRELVGYAADVLATRSNPETGDAEILMIRRGHYPFVGAWAFPGGYVDHDETAQAAAAREAGEETHLVVDAEDLAWVGLYDQPDRDPRGRVVGTAWHLHLTGAAALFEPEADDDAAAAAWVSITALLSGDLGPIAFDHERVICDAAEKYSTLIN
jgi:8-oxo-dGTP diphosphatase